MLRPLRLARLPTPIEPLPGPSERLGIEVWVKRDDLTGALLSGNKVRKLEYLLAEARDRGATAVVTCGGIQSNHCRATAAAARRLGMRCALLLRGSPPADPARVDGNLLIDRVLGAEVRWTDAAGYARWPELLQELAEDLAAAGERPYVVPEGGSNAVGALGYVRAGHEIAEQALALGVRFDAVVCATGSGGTVAGLAMAGLSARVLGISVGPPAAAFRERIVAIGEEAAERFGLRLPPPGDAWDVLDGFQGRGYALASPEELRVQVAFARETGLVLDPVYTGKAWCALGRLARGRRERLGRRVLFLHTGGTFGIFGRGAEYAAAEPGP